MKIKIARMFYSAIASPKLTLVILIYGMAIIFAATIVQTYIPIAEVKRLYLNSIVFFATIWGIKIPLFGGAAVGILACVNIVAMCYKRSKFGLYGLGISLTHMAIVLLILSGFLQAAMRVEGVLALHEGEKSDELRLADGGREKLPFEVELNSFRIENWSGSSVPKSYESDVKFNRDGDKVVAKISMNEPASFCGWTFYQSSYAEGGKVSVLSCVKNPARLLPWISVGATFVGLLLIFVPRALFGRKDYNE